jgi:hypothetical protein
LATPEVPLEVDHFTVVTPRSSDAVPLTCTAAASVETIVVPGEEMRRVGGVVSGEVGVCGGVGGTGVGVEGGVTGGVEGGVGVEGGGVEGGGSAGTRESGAPYRL